jgi:hypothetical protein
MAILGNKFQTFLSKIIVTETLKMVKHIKLEAEVVE